VSTDNAKRPGLPARLILLIRLIRKLYRTNRPDSRYHRIVSKNTGLGRLEKEYSGNELLPPLLLLKIRWYMVELLFTGELLTLLRDLPLSKEEKQNLTSLGAIMAIFDTLVDEFPDQSVPAKLLGRFIRKELSAAGEETTAPERLFYHFAAQLYTDTTEDTWQKMSAYFEQIPYQLQSAEQKQETLPEEEVLRITGGKGGVSLLLCSSLLLGKDKTTEDALFGLGAFIQFLNDAQDLRKDAEKGIRTFTAFRKDFAAIEAFLGEQWDMTRKAISALDLPPHRTYEFLFSIHALYVGISYKLSRYALICGNRLDLKSIAVMDRKEFRTDPFSPEGIRYCLPRILAF